MHFSGCCTQAAVGLKAILPGLALAMSPLPAQAQWADANSAASMISITFEPPPQQDRPRQTAGGGSRDGGRCPQDAITEQPLSASLVGETGARSTAAPTLQVQIPQTIAQAAEFSLFDQNGSGIYRTVVSFPQTPVVVTVPLPVEQLGLDSDRPYQWVFAVICDPSDRLEDRFISGWIP